MPRALKCILACYSASLWLYPAELRRSYGREMADVFEQQLLAAWTREGLRGVRETCICAIEELITIALPARIWNERLIAPVLSLIITSAVFITLVAIMQDPALAKWIDHKFLFGGSRH